MQHRADDYTILVGRESGTDEFVALVREFPSLSWVAESRVEAAIGLRHLLGDILTDMYQQGEDVPTPQETPALSDLQPA